MPDVPEEAVSAALAAYVREAYCDGEAVDGDEQVIRRTLEAAVPILAEHVAQKILAHANRQFPKTDPAKVPGQPDRWRIWHRHFGIAARIAASAFSTEEDLKRAAAEAIARGDYMVCAIPEPGGEDDGN